VTPSGSRGSVMTRLASLAARPDVNGVVIPSRATPPVAAHAAWNTNPCVADRANKVVNEITDWSSEPVTARCRVWRPIRAWRTWWLSAATTSCRWRLDDTTRAGNETGYADEFDVNGPYHGARRQPLPERRSLRRLRPDPVGDPSTVRTELASVVSSRTRTRSSPRSTRTSRASGRLDASSAFRRVRLHGRRRQLGT
jgi:hypothetical protein